MKKWFRLRHADDFARLRRDGRTYHHPFLVVSLAPNDLKHNRYGFITARRLGNAVVRNRIRRRLREAIRHFHPDLAISFDMVIIARPTVIEKPYTALIDALEELFRQANVY